ncbi:MAG: hypothetical protein CO183_00675 [Candidatus Zambryskibacteria bacterium CG_4_9_14_3_um_filter_42_9]|uniref:Thioredoxin domain-containing protein n=1 Tax=Candidatus Zambryskibacteria bacterium CG22_combo_CG10-13_8_21_14_all_42_17 TaxID=1975118 RepID=A0A2H0BEA7_9BACT|nr:MAG: hypothetical protein COX06_00330 [Candidatus Zambryskibacteria bacterium CG22_combo_CG10-13_8_21_14_all_42_17]PJA36963.1 MAG: hypothetical protein CO183_00675 [Candidatus Zambryskibacteria bacterium CG_4_9_14_3_um_filter_42_9]
MEKNKIIWFLVIVVVIMGVVWLIKTPSKPGQFDAFASCIKDSGATFYAAFWCPNCQNQEALFGRSAGLLPRVECSTPDGRGQLQVCQEANIEGYPTWAFADGTRKTGTLPLEQLSEATGCVLPGESSATENDG